MCMITYLPSGVEVPEKEIYNGGTWNQDGHGWAVAAETGVMLSGRYMDLDTALTTFKATRDAFPHAPALFHSRLATHGTVGLSNVHPFSVGKYAAVAHNGILPSKFQPSKHVTHSDTAILANYWLAGRAQTPGVWTRKERQRIGRIIGTGNKLCILSVSPYLPEPRGYLVNAAQGTWDKATGAWFSSHDFSWEWTPRKSGTGYRSGGWLWGWDSDEWSEWSGVGREKSAYDECPQCKSGPDQIDMVSGVCLVCDFCLDCLTALRDCQCYLPEHLKNKREDATVAFSAGGTEDDSLTTKEIEVRISELESGKSD